MHAGAFRSVSCSPPARSVPCSARRPPIRPIDRFDRPPEPRPAAALPSRYVTNEEIVSIVEEHSAGLLGDRGLLLGLWLRGAQLDGTVLKTAILDNICSSLLEQGNSRYEDRKD